MLTCLCTLTLIMLVCTMMLERRRQVVSGRSITEQLAGYLEHTLHESVRAQPLEHAPRAPSFLSRMYSLHEGCIAGRRLVFLVTKDRTATPANIAKHVALVREAVDAIVVFVTPSLSAYNRWRLIERGIPFVVPGRQLYIPDLAMDLRERFHVFKEPRLNALSPAAQAVLFLHLLRPDQAAVFPSLLAEQLRYSAMSIGRAFDYLVGTGLADTEMHGKERHIRFKTQGRQLFDAARDLLLSPVRVRKFVRDGDVAGLLKHAGESALSELTDLSPPPRETFAVAVRDWKAVAPSCGLVETDPEQATHIVETWAYNPACLSDTDTVDPLSLYVQFRNHRDERVSMAAERLLGRIAW